MCTVWDAAKNNDIDKLNKLINELKYYKVNSQTYNFKNTPLHYAVKYKAEKAILFLMKNGAKEYKNEKNINGVTPLGTIENVKFKDKKWVKLAKKILDEKIKDFTQLNESNIKKYLDESNNNIVENNNNLKIKNNNNKKNSNENRNTFGKNLVTNMRLINLMAKIKDTIDTNKIDIKKLFEKYDKNNKGKLSIKEFINLFKELDVQKLEGKDIEYLLICLDTNKDGELLYKEFVTLLE